MNNRAGADRDESGGRFLEILNILRKNDLQTGIGPEKLRKILEDLGPTFVKVGQILSMRKDLLPKEYCEELTKLRSDVTPMGIDDVRSVIETSCGRRIMELFSSFDETPLGSGSMAQVHAAVLPDGASVVVKVQRIGIYETMAQDITLLRRAIGVVKLVSGTGDLIDFGMLLDEFWAIAQEEMDFLQEARNLEEFRERNASVVYVSCPYLYRERTTDKVLVMEHVDGIPVDDKESLLENGYDLSEIGLKLVTNYLKQVSEDGFFQADPHPANILIRGGKIVWIDLGMMGRLSARDRKLIEQAVPAVLTGDYGMLKDIVLKLGQVRGRVDHDALYSDIEFFVARYGEAEIGELDAAVIMEEVFDVVRRHQISMPRGFSMLGRGVATLEGLIADICPELSFFDLVINNYSGSLWRRADWKKELRNTSYATFDSGRKALEIPALLSDLLKNSNKGRAKLNLEFIGTRDFAKASNALMDKLIAGMIIAALIIGSSLICLSDAFPRVLSVPLPAAFGFFLAFLLTVGLIVQNHRNRF